MKTYLETKRIDHEPNVPPEVTILVPHDATFADFINYHPDLAKALRASLEMDPETFYRLLVIEQDVFAYQAAELIAGEIQEQRAGTKIEILKVIVPRAIVDLNRVLRKAIWYTFDHQKHRDLHEALAELYLRTLDELKGKISQASMLIDLHSMSPTDPCEKVEVTPGNAKKFIQSWRKNPEKRRKNDIITQRREANGNRLKVGDEQLIGSIQSKMEKNGHDVSLSGTFELNDDHMASVWSQMVSSYCIIDFTKDNGARQKVEDADFDLFCLEYDEKRLRRLTTPIATGIVEVLKARSKE